MVKAGYDAAGRRMWKEVDGVRTYFLYDGDAPVLEFRYINNANRITAINLYGAPGLLGRRVLTYNESTGEFLSAQTIYYQCEATGNVVHRLNESGAILTTQLYDAYGQLMNVRDGSGQEQNPSVLADDPYGYKGRFGYYTDHETDLILCTHRYYDPQIGRWLTRDPIGYDDGLNLYRYCGNNPVTGVDPSGQVVETIADIVSIGWSIYDLVRNPSLANVGFLAWDIGATFIPCVPGSYVAKGGKLVGKLITKVNRARKATDVAVKWIKYTKHVLTKGQKWTKSVISATGIKGAAAKYVPSLADPNKLKQLELMAWEYGTELATNKPATQYKVLKFENIIGAADGKETKYVLVEMTSGGVHGRPVSPEYLLKQFKHKVH